MKDKQDTHTLLTHLLNLNNPLYTEEKIGPKNLFMPLGVPHVLSHYNNKKKCILWELNGDENHVLGAKLQINILVFIHPLPLMHLYKILWNQFLYISPFNKYIPQSVLSQ